MQGSLVNKIKNIKPGERIIIFPKKDYKTLMRNIGSDQSRDKISKDVSYKKALVLIDDQVSIGVAVFRKEKENNDK